MRTATKHKQKASQRRRSNLFERVKHKIGRIRRPILAPTPETPKFSGDRFLSVTFDPVPYLSVFKQGSIGPKELVNVARKHATALVSDIEGGQDYITLMKFAERFDMLCKNTDFEWFVGEVDSLPAIVFYHDLGALGGWIPIRINFLNQLRRRSKNWHFTVLNCLRHMTKSLLFSDANDAHYAMDMIDEQMEEWDDEEEEEGYSMSNRAQMRQLLHSYRDGKIRQEMNAVQAEPELTIEECLVRLNKLPVDLVALKTSLTEVLELCGRGVNLANYDLRYGSGIREVEQFEDYYISIDRQFNWVYDYDSVCDEIESHLDADYSGGGEQPLTVWRILAENFIGPESLEAFLKEITALKNDPFPIDFDKTCGHLCRTINELFPSKFK